MSSVNLCKSCGVALAVDESEYCVCCEGAVELDGLYGKLNEANKRIRELEAKPMHPEHFYREHSKKLAARVAELEAKLREIDATQEAKVPNAR